MSSSNRLQKLREQRARANAARAAAAPSSLTALSQPVSLTVNRPAAFPSRTKAYKSVESTKEVSSAPKRINRTTCKPMKEPISPDAALRSSCDATRTQSSSSNEEWFRYTNGSTDSKLQSSGFNSRAQKHLANHTQNKIGRQPRGSDSMHLSPPTEEKRLQSVRSTFESNALQSASPTPSKKSCSVTPASQATKNHNLSNNATRHVVQLKQPPKDSDSFTSAKSRFETHSTHSTSTSGSVLSGIQKSYRSVIEPKKHAQSNAASCREVPWPSENSSKEAVTPSPASKVSTNPFISNDKNKDTTLNVKQRYKPVSLDKFLSIHETNKSTAASLKTNGSSNTFGIALRRAESSPIKSDSPRRSITPSKSKTQPNSRYVTPEPLKRNMSSPSKNTSRNNFKVASTKRTVITPSKSTLQFHGNGTPVWVHASLFQESGLDNTGWEWIRAFMQENNSKELITVLLADTGCTYTVQKRDGSILMGNSWWSSDDFECDTRQAPSPTSVAQFDNSTSRMPPGDLVELAHLHEPAIVHALQARFKQGLIYTYTGAILLALNPFKKLDHLYTRDVMELYWTNGNGVTGGSGTISSSEGEVQPVTEKPPPHAYAVAERAFNCMLRSLGDRDHCRSTADLPPCDQSILVSGESGAGKTVTTKIIMRYLTILSQRQMNKRGSDVTGQGLSVENQVLQSNPVLESFGNARTIRNDNSSRFGKFIEMSFSSSQKERGSLLGASIQFYLLEKVRLVSVNPGERNYHVFYEVLSSGMSLKEKKRYMLTSNFGSGSHLSTVNDFYMTSVSGTFDRSRDKVKDSDTYRELRMALDTIGFDANEQDGIFCIVAALLHASNLRFVPETRSEDGSEGCVVYEKDGTLAAVTNLLGVPDEAFKLALTSSVIEARGERLLKKLTVEKAEKALEALVKATYAGLFTYIVKRINESIEVHSWNGDPNVPSDVATIGVLDIFGFESFDTNSFEQLCINYCNEALQQQFNRFVFKAEQAEYEYEGISWSNIEFSDNQEALDLIEGRRDGIFSVLDEQCRLQRCTDNTFIRAVYDKCEANEYFEASQMQKSKGVFVIDHYAGKVEYESDGFLVKNKDERPKSSCELLAASKTPLISGLSLMMGPSSGDGTQGSLRRSPSSFAQSSVSSQFTSQLRDLRSRISMTGPHYIRCLKPNDHLVPDHFEESLIAHQLNCAGVLPAMKMARAGYSMRYSHSSFMLRFRVIVSQELSSRPRIERMKLTSNKLLTLLSAKLEKQMKKRENSSLNGISDVVAWGVQIGKTKVFLREPAFAALEELRLSTIKAAATRLQVRIRGYLCRARFLLILGSATTLQCAARKFLACLRIAKLRCESKAIVIQSQWRSYSSWVYFQNILFIAIWCQRFWRSGKVRECFSSIKEYRAVIAIQTFWRSYIQHQVHRQVRDAAIVVQCAFRVWMATRMIRFLRREARDVNLIARERDQLRLEMKQMRLELDEIKKNHTTVSGSSICMSQSSLSKTLGIDPTLQSNSDEIKLLYQECAKKDRELKELREKVDSLSGSKSVAPTLPTTVTISQIGSPSYRPTSQIRMHSSSNLLDSELVGLEDLECSQISTNDDSFDDNQLPSLHLSLDTQLNDLACMHEFTLHNAVKNNDKLSFLNEIEHSPNVDIDINSVDLTGRTPLHIAVQLANMDFVQLILSHNVVVNTQDISGNTALHFAQSFDIACMLLCNGVNPNIPNCDGLCALHLAVKRRDFAMVRCLLSHGANVTVADDVCWYTPLHLIAHAETTEEKAILSVRGPIAELLCEVKHPPAPDLNYQDRDGNTPLHHAASLAEEDAGILISIFIEHGACPKVVNNRGQTPIHLYCHNKSVRQYVFYHEALQLMLAKGDPNQQSLSGCTPLHLALYHRDIESARLLVRFGAELNTRWRKPLKWEAFWTDMESEVVLPLDMVEDLNELHSILADISTEQYPAPHRSNCMHCKAKFRLFMQKHNCSYCGRSICGRCSGSLQASFIPHSGGKEGAPMKVCVLCEAMLLSNRVTTSFPSSIPNDGNQSELSIGTISM